MVKQIDSMPNMKKGKIKLNDIPLYQYSGGLKMELREKRLQPKEAIYLLEQMMMIRYFEEMILALKSQAYPPLQGFDYRGPTHLSIGQEATSVGACAVLNLTDFITSTHRGHGDGIAKGCMAVIQRSRKELLRWLGDDQVAELKGQVLLDRALDEHIYRTIAELFGKEDGYCAGRGGGMHIADFSAGHLGANAIVGGSVGIATGAALSGRYRGKGEMVLCFAGDGAYSNGITLESLCFSSMDQFNNELANKPFGLPIIYVLVNNQYAMTGQEKGEIAGLDYLAQRAAGVSRTNFWAEVVDGMNVLAVLDATKRAKQRIDAGEGPVLLELMTYRFKGHSLSDPRTSYRDKAEETAWLDLDPIETFSRELISAGIATDKELKDLAQKVLDRQERMAVKAVKAQDPSPEQVGRYVFTELKDQDGPQKPSTQRRPSTPARKERNKQGELMFQDAIREAIIEEMLRDERVVLYGEDVADYGGAFKVTKDLLEMFGRDRVFNACISEAAIIGTGVGASMTGLRPIVELMYSDFEFQAGDQLFNQASKWSFMSGGQTAVPLVVRTSAGCGKGYGGQHSQNLESHAAHTPGIKIAVPFTPADAKGLLKSAIRDQDPVMFVESQLLYKTTGIVPQDEDFLVPFGQAAVRREGTDVTIVAWSYMVYEALKAAEALAEERIQAEVIDLRTICPLDMSSILQSVSKTGRAVIAAQAVKTAGFTAEIASRIQEEAFDDLDGPVLRVGAMDSISPQAEILEKTYLPWAEDIVESVKRLL